MIVQSSSFLPAAQACVLLCNMPINWLSPQKLHNFLNYVYNAYMTQTYLKYIIYRFNPKEGNQDGPMGLGHIDKRTCKDIKTEKAH